MRTFVVLAAAALILVVGCGDPPRITSSDKDQIADAVITISLSCVVADAADPSDIESAVNELLDLRDKLGDQTFTISRPLTNVTMQDMIDRSVKDMRKTGCVPKQAARLEGD